MIGPVDAFAMLMYSARQLSCPAVPMTIDNPKNRKQQLRNDFIAFLTTKNLKWHGSEVNSSGEAFVRAMVDTLWTIDGHHGVFESRNCSIPSCFSSFVDYNVPELSRHRKRTIENLSSSVLQTCSNALFACLQGVYWEQPQWKAFKPDVVQLATSLAKYRDYLSNQLITSKRIHLAETPVRQLSENLGFLTIPLNHSRVSPHLSTLVSKLDERDLFEYVLIEDICPKDPRKKYEYVSLLKSMGLPVNTVMLTYSHGNNIGNLHFVWKVPVYGDSFSQSQ